MLALAAYNAGGGRVQQWIDAYGDPRAADVDPVDWVERIPFDETRDYVQHVYENLQVYRVRLTEVARIPAGSADRPRRARGFLDRAPRPGGPKSRHLPKSAETDMVFARLLTCETPETAHARSVCISLSDAFCSGLTGSRFGGSGRD